MRSWLAHDSFAFSSDPLACEYLITVRSRSFLHTYLATLVARDQEVDIPSQLGLGVRLLQAQSHMFVHPIFADCDMLNA